MLFHRNTMWQCLSRIYRLQVGLQKNPKIFYKMMDFQFPIIWEHVHQLHFYFLQTPGPEFCKGNWWEYPWIHEPWATSKFVTVDKYNNSNICTQLHKIGCRDSWAGKGLYCTLSAQAFFAKPPRRVHTKCGNTTASRLASFAVISIVLPFQVHGPGRIGNLSTATGGLVTTHWCVLVSMVILTQHW